MIKMDGEIMTMKYRNYKLHYADCKTVPGSYNPLYKTIEVIVPVGREKKSGTRGKRYDYFPAYFYDSKENFVYVMCFKAMNEELAEKQIEKYVKEFNYINRLDNRLEAENICKKIGKNLEIYK